MTRAILLPVVFLIVGLFLFAIIQYFSNKNNAIQWEDEKKVLEDALNVEEVKVKELEYWISNHRW